MGLGLGLGLGFGLAVSHLRPELSKRMAVSLAWLG